MIDLQSIMGYRRDSPFKNNPYLDISTEDGIIDMSHTDIDLLGVDNMGNKKIMKAGMTNPYKFEGDIVREYPMQKGGFSKKQFYDYLFKDDEDEKEEPPATAPSQEEIPQQVQQEENPDDAVAMQQATAVQLEYTPYKEYADEQYTGNPYSQEIPQPAIAGSGNPYSESGFQQFNTPEEGFGALMHQLNLYQTGKTRNNVGPNDSLLHAMSVYAPAGDGANNPTIYANFIAKRLGVSPYTAIANIDTKKWAEAIAKMEGNRKGNNPGNLRTIR